LENLEHIEIGMIEAIVKKTGRHVYLRTPGKEEYSSFEPDYIEVDKDFNTIYKNNMPIEFMTNEVNILWNKDNAIGVEDLIKKINNWKSDFQFDVNRLENQSELSPYDQNELIKCKAKVEAYEHCIKMITGEI